MFVLSKVLERQTIQIPKSRLAVGRRQTGFVRSQWQQVQAGGGKILAKKIVKFIKELPGILTGLILVICIRLLRPFFLIRLGRLDSSRLGHFAVDTEIYLCMRDAGKHEVNGYDVFYHEHPICNTQLKMMWDRVLHVSSLAHWADWVNQKIPGGEIHRTPKRMNRDIYGLIGRTSPHLFFTEKEERKGQEALTVMGLGQKPYICFHARDRAYLDQVYPKQQWRYHDYRDSDIRHYLPAVQALIQSGYNAVRMGSIVRAKLSVSDPRIIDYVTNGMRSDFFDIYLGAKCEFFICSATGVSEIPRIFRRPIVFVNFVPLEDLHSWGPRDLLIFKKYWKRDEKRFMMFREILESGAGRYFFSEEFERHNIEVIENTPEEILAVTLEMEKRLKGTWSTTPEDESLQKRFWDLFKSSDMHHTIVSRIGADFLKQNQHLI